MGISLTVSGRDMHTALTIAGSDCSGGAGIQADIKTMTMNGVYAMSVITALTAQNTTGVTGIMEVSPDFLKMQIDAVFTDIFPDAVKIGMVSSPALIEVIAERLTFYKAKNIVVDPVMVATSGAKLITDDAIDVLIKKLMPLATVITPNIPEGEILSGMKITCREDMEKAAKLISEKISTDSGQTVSVLLKGGHSICDADDLLYSDGRVYWYKGTRIDNPNTHGTGCTLSSAIASMLAIGVPLDDSISEAKTYITGALEAGLDLGSGSGPLMHNYQLYEKA
jgi:hydroxymethylpyrimidine/phosphomethylpyrimidine kinase